MFNAWASLESKRGKLGKFYAKKSCLFVSLTLSIPCVGKARWVLDQGLQRFPQDNNLLQAAGMILFFTTICELLILNICKIRKNGRKER